MSKLVLRENSPYRISIHLVQEYVIKLCRWKTANSPRKWCQRYIKSCRAYWCHLPGLGQGGHPPKRSKWAYWDPGSQAPVLLLPNILLSLFPIDGGREWGMEALVADAECHIRCLKDSWGNALSGLPSPYPLELSKSYLLFPSFTFSPSTCGNCPLPWVQDFF